MSDNDRIVRAGYFATLLSYLFLVPVLVWLFASLTPSFPDVFSIYVPVFVYGMGWLKIAAYIQEKQKEVGKK